MTKYFNIILLLLRVLAPFLVFHFFFEDFEITLCGIDSEEKQKEHADICKRLSKRVLKEKTKYNRPVVYDTEKNSKGDTVVAFKAGDMWIPGCGSPTVFGCMEVNKTLGDMIARGQVEK